jgi:iron(III) transport system substrate-binding protein
LKKYGWLIAFFVLLGLPMAMRAWVGTSSQSLTQNAPRLVITTMEVRDICNEYRWAFSDWHQKHYGTPVDVEYLNPGGTSDVLRQLQSVYTSVRNAHGGQLPPEDQMDTGVQMVWGGGDQFFERELKPMGILRPLDLSKEQLAEIFPQPVLGGSNLYDRKSFPPKWVGACLSSFGIVYNPALCADLGAPNPATWSDLASPKFDGALALADPTHSGTAAAMYMIILQRAMLDAEEQHGSSPASIDAGWKRGMGELTLIAANARYFATDSSRVPTDVSLGQAAVGTAIDYYGRVTEEAVGPGRVRFIAPQSATASNPDPIGILYGTHGESLVLANHFIEFMLSPEGQRLWILKVGEPGGPRQYALRRGPIRKDVYADRTGWADDVDYFSQAGTFALRPEWMSEMPALRTIWAAAWIDDNDDLKSAYKKILAVSDPGRREKLLAELADLPITRSEVDHPATAAANSDPGLQKAEQRLALARRFAEHYRQVGDEAEGQ